jgi:SPP1 family predicted phage head-tail adaptor
MDERRRNRRVVIQQLAAGQDDIGQPVQTWSALATVFANIKHLSGLETIKGGAETSAAKVSIRIGYRADVTAAMRVLDGSTAYEIKAVLPDREGKKHTDLACQVIT